MNILYVLDSYYPKIDGPAIVIDSIATILTNKHLAQVDILVPKYPKYIDNTSYNIIRSKSIPASEGYRAGLPFLDFHIKKELKKKKYDIVHIHSPFTLGKYALRYANKYNIPVINTVHTAYHLDFERKLKSKVLRAFMMNFIHSTIKKSDYLFTVSKGFANQLHNKPYNQKKPICVVRNATEYKDMDLTDEIDKLKEKHNIKNEFIFLFVGRIVKNKNIQFSLKCLKILKEHGFSNFKFIIVGEGDYANTLSQLARKYNLLDNIIFTGLIRDRKILATYYKMSNLFMFPSIFDTCGIVLLEAASFGLPSFTIEGTCAGELIEDGKNGFVAPENPKIWAEKLQTIVKNKRNIDKMKTIVRQTLCKTWEDITLEYFNIYKNITLIHTMKNYSKKTTAILTYKKLIKPSKIKGIFHISQTIVKL